MKKFFQQVVRKNAFFLLGAGWLFTLAFIIDNYWISSSSPRYLKNNIQQDIQKQEKDFDNLLLDTLNLGNLVDQHYSPETLEQLVDKPYSLFLYQLNEFGENSLAFWNNQLVLPGNDLLLGKESNKMVHMLNGQYEFIRREVSVRGKAVMAVAMVPIRREYFIENNNLKREFVNYPQAEKAVTISTSPTDYPVISNSGRTLFYLSPKLPATPDHSNWLTLTLNIIAVLLLLMAIHNMAHYVSETRGYLAGILLLLLWIVVLRGLTYMFPSLLNFRHYEMFNPYIYSSGYILSSLGDLLINCFLFCWLVLFIRREVGERRFSLTRSKSWYWIVVTLPVLLLVSTTFVFADIIKTLILDAKIPFNVTNIFMLNVYSFVGFVILATLSLSYFFLSQVVLQLIAPLIGDRRFLIFILIAIIGLLLLTVVQNTTFVQLNIYVLIWLLVYVWFMQQQIIEETGFQLAISEVLVWLFIFSASISGLIIIENRQIELEQRKGTAEKLSTQSDPSNELLLNIALAYFDNNFLSSNFNRFRQQTSNVSLKDSLTNKNFSPYLDKYDTRIFTFDSSTKPLFNEYPVSYDTLNTIFRVEGRATNVPDLRYFEKSYDKFSYIYRKAVTDTGNHPVGYFFVISEPKRYKTDALIPELFKTQKEYLPEYSPDYTFAVYSRAKNETQYSLIDYYNEYQFPTSLEPSVVPQTEFTTIKRAGYDELWYRDNDKVVVIARKDSFLLEAITLFAWLFSTFLILLAFFRLLAVLVQTRLRWHLMKKFLQVNLRSQIHGTFIFITLISFVVIFVATTFFFYNRYKRNNIDRLSKAIQIMNNQIQAEIVKRETFDDMVKIYQSGSGDRNKLEDMVKRVAEIHGTDINFYDLQGDLVVSSNPFVYNKGILSDKMNPVAFYNLDGRHLVQFINDEQMGSVSYQSIYSPVRDGAGKAYAYLNIPSFDSQAELKREISNFLVTIINLNAFIFLIAGALALFITNRITSSFTLIGEKMRAINLGKMNEEIPWNRDDEIGGLVTEYNKMVNKLGASAAQLAKSEREGAWREMARQVAHEIKNPLTPMKLSIQYLQKAIDNNSPNVKEMTAGVAKTLVEQIDHLSKIASDFSQFANIGNPKSEVFDLHEMLHSLSSLYLATEHLQFSWEPLPQRIMLFADKTQLNRLFTNLLQNAVEACENQEDKRVSMTEELSGDYVIVKVTDNGEGIPPQIQEKIFTPNFTTKTSGTGLGLAMSKSIAEQAKGELWFETTEGAGSSFFVKIPLLRATA